MTMVQYIALPEIHSTNSWMLDGLSNGIDFADETVAYTLRQTAGRGQMGNGWESELDKNITFSMLLKPVFLPIPRQFLISEVCCVGAIEALEQLAIEQGQSLDKVNLSIKWPNDLYAGDQKLGGILIENRLIGSTFSHSILGVGINVNQEIWAGNAPNPVSLRLLGIDTTPESVLQVVTASISKRYHQFKEGKEASSIHHCFIQKMYRRVGMYPYHDPHTGETFMASIVDVDAQGPIILELSSGERRRYWFKEVQFVLPCGVTKE